MRRGPARHGRAGALHYSDRVASLEDPVHTLAGGAAGWRAYAGAAAFCAGAALLVAPVAGALDTASLVLVFLLAVVLAAARFGRGPALLAAGLAVLLLNLFFVPPRFSLAVADERFFFTFAVMLAVGLVVGQLTAGLKAQARAASERERRMRSLYEVSRELGGALTVEQVAEGLARFAGAQFEGRAGLCVIDRQDRLQPVATTLEPGLLARAAEVARTGHGSPGRPDHHELLLPLKATMAVRGVLVLEPRASGELPAEQRELMNTCATLLAGALERIHYIEVAQASALEVQGERLRNTLLAGLSHDLRTPLASLVGLAETLRLTRPAPSAQQLEIADAMAASARRMSALANNLLDMARLESGQVRFDWQWQPVEEVLGAALAATAAVLAQHRVVVELPADLPWLRLDAVLMERVLVNLLENASKYTPAGTRVAVRGTATDDAVLLEVADQGPGLPAGREDEVFKKFERGQREGPTAGVGLGLALCRSIVEAHGGRIHAEPAPAGGTRFVMRLPRGEPPPRPWGEPPAPEGAA